MIKKGERKTLFLPIQVQVLIQVQAQVRMMIQTVKKKIVMNPHQEMKILEEGNQIKEKRRKNKRKRKGRKQIVIQVTVQNQLVP